MRLPWADVNGRPGHDVARLLEPFGLVPAPRERYKWACPSQSCTSSDGFHTFPRAGRRSICYVCQLRLTNVDLAATVRGEDPRDACRWLAGQLGIHVDTCYPGVAVAPRSPPSRPPTPAPRPPTPLEALLAMPNPVMPEVVYAEILERTTLTRAGAAYMRGRGIPPEFARDLGFRSIDGPGGWAALRRHLAAGFTKETLRAAGFPPDDRGRVWIPFGGLLPMVLIPYRQGGKTVFIRMRTSGPPPGRLLRVIPDWSSRTKRYRSPLDAQPSLPFNADALGRPTVHAVEGEFNTTTLILPEYGLDAVGTPGAGVFDPAWVPLLAGARVVTWFDDDHAGDLARTRLTALFTEVLGAEWVARNLYHMRLPSGADPNHLHVRGMLAPLIHGSPWSSIPA